MAGEGGIHVEVVARDRLIFALDMPSAGEADRLLDRLQGHISFVKVGLELYTAAGPDMSSGYRTGHGVFLDLKFLDIEETVRRATARVAAMGVDFLTVHANRKALTAAVQGREGSALKLLAVTVLTNFDSQDLREMGVQRTVQDLVTARALLAFEVGCDGVVASGEEPAAIRQKVGPRFVIVTPGVRPAGRRVDDHARARRRLRPLPRAPTIVVIGRPFVTQSIGATVAAIIAEMQGAFECAVGVRL